MTDTSIINWFGFGTIIGGTIVHIFWKVRFRESFQKYSNFLHYLKQGYSVEAAWKMAGVTI